jgi:hypothetical protein
MPRRLVSIFSFCAFALVGGTTTLAHAEEPSTSSEPASAPEVPPPDYPPPSSRWKVAGVGLAAGAVFYGIGAGISYVDPDAPGLKDLRIPVAGPWIAIGHAGCPADDTSCTNLLVAARVFLYALSGLAQAGSIGVILEGLAMPTQEAAAPTARPAPKAPKAPPPPPGGNDKNLFFVPTPMTVGQGGVGVGVVGRF